MAIVVSEKQRIYFQVEGEKGAFLMLHHGLFGSHQDWYRHGYVEALSQEFRLIILDARGHGRSDRPLLEADYTPELFAGDLLRVMDELDIRNAHFMGYSLGALVGFHLLNHHPERVRVCVLGGEAPFMTPEGAAFYTQLAEGLNGGAETANRVLRQGLPPLDFGEGEERQSQIRAAQALARGLAAWPLNEERSNPVNSPITLLVGEDDPAAARVEKSVKTIPRARFVKVARKNHSGLFLERETLVEGVLRMARSGKRADGGRDGGEMANGQQENQPEG